MVATHSTNDLSDYKALALYNITKDTFQIATEQYQIGDSLYCYRPIANQEKARRAPFALSVVTVHVFVSKAKIAATNAEPEVPVLSTA